MNQIIPNIGTKTHTHTTEGSKIPITEVHINVRDKQGNIVYSDIAVVCGHNIPSDQIKLVREFLKQKYLAKRGRDNGRNLEPIRRSIEE